MNRHPRSALSLVLALAAALTLAGLSGGAAGADNALGPFGAVGAAAQAPWQVRACRSRDRSR